MDFQQHKTPVEESVFTVDLSEVPDARLGNGFVCCVYWASLSKPHIASHVVGKYLFLWHECSICCPNVHENMPIQSIITSLPVLYMYALERYAPLYHTKFILTNQITRVTKYHR